MENKKPDSLKTLHRLQKSTSINSFCNMHDCKTVLLKFLSEGSRRYFAESLSKLL